MSLERLFLSEGPNIIAIPMPAKLSHYRMVGEIQNPTHATIPLWGSDYWGRHDLAAKIVAQIKETEARFERTVHAVELKTTYIPQSFWHPEKKEDVLYSAVFCLEKM
jgi:hypothetical protein